MLSEFFCFTVAKFSVGESFTVALICGSGKVYGQEGEGSIKIFSRKIFSHNAENFRRESFSVALVSGAEKVWIRRGEYQVIPSRIFVPQS